MAFFPLLIFLTLLVVTVALTWLIPRQKYKKRQDLAQTLAAQRGWTFLANPAYDPNLIYLLVNQGNQPQWELVGTKSRSTGGRSQIPAGNRWHTEAVRLSDDKVVIAPFAHQPPFNAGAKIGKSFTGRIINLVLTPYGIGDVSQLSVQKIGSPAFQQRFFCLSGQEKRAAQILSPAVEQELLSWPAAPNPHREPWLVIDGGGITIRLFDDRPENETVRLDQLVYLGLALSQAVTSLHKESGHEF